MKTYVLYHGPTCLDGFTAAWVAHTVLQGDGEYIPVQYGQEPPALEPRSRLYLLDFCYSREQLWKWWMPGPGAVEHLIVLDHHKTAQAALEGFDEECVANQLDCPHFVFDMNKSGARLAWEHFYQLSGCPAPGIVQYVEDRDLWNWKLPSSREVNAALRSYPLDFAVWDKFGKSNTWDLRVRLTVEGKAILRSERRLVDEHVRRARTIELDGYTVRAVNATVLASEIAGALAEGWPFGACYFDREDGVRQWSLRSTDAGVDVSEIARKHGGGGHCNAAGFECQPAVSMQE